MFMPTLERRICGALVALLAVAAIVLLSVRTTHPGAETIPVTAGTAAADLQLVASCTYGTDNAALDSRPWDDESGGYMRNTELLAWKVCGGVKYGRYFAYRFYASDRDTKFGPEWTHLNCSDGVMRNVKVNAGNTGAYNPAERVKACESDADGMTVLIDPASDWRVTSDFSTGTTITIDRAGLTDPHYSLPTLVIGR